MHVFEFFKRKTTFETEYLFTSFPVKAIFKNLNGYFQQIFINASIIWHCVESVQIIKKGIISTQDAF